MAHPPMILRSVHVRHYKSLGDVRVEFNHPITVIVGPNAVGKTNFVSSLLFARDAVMTGLERAVAERGGITRIRQYSKTKPYKVSFDFGFEQRFEHVAEPHAARYSLSLQSEAGGNYRVEQERADSVYEGHHRSGARDEPEWVLFDASFTRDAEGRIAVHDDTLERNVREDQLALDADSRFLDGRDMGAPIAAFMRGWRCSSIFPNTLRTPTSLDKDTVLAEEGTNWASVIKALKRSARGRTVLDRVTEAMQMVVPGFKDVTVASVGSYLVPQFRFESGGQIVEFDPVQLSDGTLRIFGLLLALYQTPAPALLVIEEPEQTVHPGVLGVLVDAMREASETTQIIVTTHSPHFVDRFAPHEIRVATLVDGLTRIAPIKSTQVEAVKQRLMSLEEFMLAEGLQPEEG